MSDAVLYVSWGGTGRAASLRHAMRNAQRDDRGLIYLAVLDDEHFDDLDHSVVELMAQELEWLLDAQLELTKSQIGADELALSLRVRTGRVVELVAETAAELNPAEVLVGAPVPVSGDESIDELVGQLAQRTGCPVELVLPDFE